MKITTINKSDDDVSLASGKDFERGRHSFCLSFLAKGKSSRNGATTYPQYCVYPEIPQVRTATNQLGQGEMLHPCSQSQVLSDRSN
jgi:hypothetical protein